MDDGCPRHRHMAVSTYFTGSFTCVHAVFSAHRLA